MATKGEAGAGVVGNQVFGLGWFGELAGFSSGLRWLDAAQQIELSGDSGDCPGGLPAMAGQVGQRAGRGEQIEIPVRQPRARREIGNAGKSVLPAGFEQAQHSGL